MKQYAIPLILTTPYMHGDAVRDAQWLMQGNNRHKGLAPYKDGKLDGIYGPTSALATQRTKYWLGYPENAIDKHFGQVLYEYLLPMTSSAARPLPEDYKRRRNARIAAAARTPGMKALDWAITQLGYEESPYGSNRTKYGIEYGFNGVPWCAIFESVGFRRTGWTRYRYAACVNIHYDALAGRNGLRRVFSPQRGDVVIYTLHGDRFAHTAFYEKPLAGGMFQDLGGNTGSRSFNNGGAVARGQRHISQVTSFIRVG